MKPCAKIGVRVSSLVCVGRTGDKQYQFVCDCGKTGIIKNCWIFTKNKEIQSCGCRDAEKRALRCERAKVNGAIRRRERQKKVNRKKVSCDGCQFDVSYSEQLLGMTCKTEALFDEWGNCVSKVERMSSDGQKNERCRKRLEEVSP